MSYHHMRKISIQLCKIDGKSNIADLLTKTLERNTLMQHIGKILSFNMCNWNLIRCITGIIKYFEQLEKLKSVR
jgi:hypothetical protein